MQTTLKSAALEGGKMAIMRFGIMIFSLMIRSTHLNAQTAEDSTIETFADIDGYSTEDDWYYFDNGLDSTLSTEVFTTFKPEFELTEFDSLVLVETHTDDLGMVHSTYTQLYKNVPVEGSMVVTHGTDAMIQEINGYYAKNLSLDVDADISEETALAYALATINAEMYAWEDSSLEAELKLDEEDENATYYPTGILFIAKNFLLSDSIYKLCWRYDITTVLPESKSYTIYIDAENGDVLQILNRGMFCDGVVGSGSTYYGTKNFDARHQWIFSIDVFTLEDCDRGDGIHTKKYDGSGDIDWSNTDESHGHGPSASEGTWSGSEIESVTAHWIAELTYDCFLDNFGRHNFDGSDGKDLRIITECTPDWKAASDYDNISATHSYLSFGYHEISGGAMERMDVVGHEWTHLFSESELNWAWLAEPQAINEAISDIFGNYVEAYIKATSYDYLCGEDVYTDRSMADPTAYGDPDTYAEINWADASGVNSGPFNKMFYLLANGGTHPETGVTVTGIGIDDAIAIMYKVVDDHYISGSATYASARTACINAAKDLFGDCSVQARQVARAFGAIGVGSATGNGIACVSIIDVDPFYPCEEDLNERDIVFTAQYLPSTATVVWTIPTGWTGSASGPGNSICTITHVTDATTKTITATVVGVKNTSVDTYEFQFQDCNEDGCPPLCRFETENPAFSGTYYIYPNPAFDLLKIQTNAIEQSASCSVINSLGEIVKTTLINADYAEIDIHDLSSGFYLISISYGDKHELFKLTIQ